jgi:hypothetical protein
MNDSLKTEIVNLAGATFRYYAVEGSDPALFRGFQIKTVERAFKIKMSMDDLPGQNRIAGLMGLFDDLYMRGTVTLSHWRMASTYGEGFAGPGSREALKSPRIGDVLLCEANGLLYDVVNVNNTYSMFQYKSHAWTIGFKPFEDKKYLVGDSISADDPIRKLLAGIYDPEEPAGECLFSVPEPVIQESARIYQPGETELPPRNDKANPFPVF